MKKLISLALAFMMCILSVSLFACSNKPEPNPVTDFEYEYGEEYGGIAIIKYIGTSKSIVFPEEIDGQPVKVIGRYLLDDEDNDKMRPLIESVVIPDTVEVIVDMTFYGCTSLVSVDFGNGVREIGDEAFHRCEALERIILPPKLETIGASAFYGCTSAEELFIPKTVTTWGKSFNRGAFGECTSLKKITIEEGLETLGFWCEFALSSSLEEIEIPASVKKIGSQLFVGCTSLTKVVFKGNAPIVESGTALTNVFGYEDFKEDLVIYYDSATEGWDTVEWRGRYRMEPLS